MLKKNNVNIEFDFVASIFNFILIAKLFNKNKVKKKKHYIEDKQTIRFENLCRKEKIENKNSTSQ